MLSNISYLAKKILKMRYLLFFSILWLSITACSSDDDRRRNPNLLDVNIDLRIDTSLPQYINLRSVMNPIYIPEYGNGGIFVMKTGENAYVAWDAADPNHPRNNQCIGMYLEGLNVICACEQNTYSIFTGAFTNNTENLKYTLYPYLAQANGRFIYISN